MFLLNFSYILGVTFKTNVNVGKDISAKEMSEEYDAVVLCTGATWPRDLPLPGRQLEGIYFAMEFLETWQKKQLGGTHTPIIAKDKHVIIIGKLYIGFCSVTRSIHAYYIVFSFFDNRR